MRQKRKVRCIFADTLDCFLIAATKGGCKHIKKHYKEYACNLKYCIETGRNNVHCERTKGKKKCKTKKKKQLFLDMTQNYM